MTETTPVTMSIPLPAARGRWECGRSHFRHPVPHRGPGGRRHRYARGGTRRTDRQGPPDHAGLQGKPEETASTLKDGWIYTGDIATMDEDGYFYIVDRKKDMIISGGYNVYPRDIDEVYYDHPKVQEACSSAFPTRRAARTSNSLSSSRKGKRPPRRK